MHIRRYFLAASMLIFVICWGIYIFITKESTSIELFDIVLPSLPIAVWVAIAMSVLLLATVLHMIFHTITLSIKLGRFESDAKRAIDSFVDAYLQKSSRSHKFKTERYKLFGELIDNTNMKPDTSLSISRNKKVAAVVEMINKIDSGEPVNLKSFSLAVDNPLVVKNSANMFRSSQLSAEKILSSDNLYTKELKLEAYLSISKNAPVHLIEKYRESVTMKALLEILSRVDAKKDPLSIANETIIDLIDRLGDLSSIEYLKIADAMTHISPDKRIETSKRLSSENAKATDAYLYTLFDLEMIDSTCEILDNSSDEEFVLFKAFSDLKESGKHYDIKTLIALLLHK